MRRPVPAIQDRAGDLDLHEIEVREVPVLERVREDQRVHRVQEGPVVAVERLGIRVEVDHPIGGPQEPDVRRVEDEARAGPRAGDVGLDRLEVLHDHDDVEARDALAAKEDVAGVARAGAVDRVDDRVDVPLAHAEIVLAGGDRTEADPDPIREGRAQAKPVVPIAPHQAAPVDELAERPRPDPRRGEKAQGRDEARRPLWLRRPPNGSAVRRRRRPAAAARSPVRSRARSAPAPAGRRTHRPDRSRRHSSWACWVRW